MGTFDGSGAAIVVHLRFFRSQCCYRRSNGRFVRAAGAVKALRTRTLGGEGASIGFAASRLAKSLVDKINGWDAARDGKLEKREFGHWQTGRMGTGKPCTYVCARLVTLTKTVNPRRRTARDDGQVMMQATALTGGSTRTHRQRTPLQRQQRRGPRQGRLYDRERQRELKQAVAAETNQ